MLVRRYLKTTQFPRVRGTEGDPGIGGAGKILSPLLTPQSRLLLTFPPHNSRLSLVVTKPLPLSSSSPSISDHDKAVQGSIRYPGFTGCCKATKIEDFNLILFTNVLLFTRVYIIHRSQNSLSRTYKYNVQCTYSIYSTTVQFHLHLFLVQLMP